MKKSTAALLASKLAARNNFVAFVIETAEETTIFTVDDSNANVFNNDELGMILSEVGLVFKNRNEKVEIELGQHFKELQKARIEIDKLVEKQSAKAIAKGERKFTIKTEKLAEDQPEVFNYLTKILGLKVEMSNYFFFCEF